MQMLNFDSNANVDDGSCVPKVYGCIDPRAFNFDSFANVDDGSCMILGCTHPNASNVDYLANVDNGSCRILGCTNTRAANYLASATDDDGLCVILGCLNRYSVLFDRHANTDDGSCVQTQLGCMDPSSSNFNADANVDDFSCVGRCVPDLAWSDSDGEGCSKYYLGYCGFEDSAKRCPTVCGTFVVEENQMVCSKNERPGCDGVVGSGEQIDHCGLCGGNNSCTSCEAAVQYFCARVISVYDELGGSVDACITRVADLGGRAILGRSVITSEDCHKDLDAWKLFGFSSNVSCATSQSDCKSNSNNNSASTNLSVSCIKELRELSPSAWDQYCPMDISRTAVLCDSHLEESFQSGSGCDFYNISI